MAGSPATESYSASGSSDYERTVDVALGLRETKNGPKKAAGWSTPGATDYKGASSRSPGKERPTSDYDLPTQAANLTGWNTPRATDGSNGGPNQAGGALPADAAGMMPSGYPAETGKRGALNPALSRWLMGFPEEWDACAPMGTRSSPRSRQNLSKR